MTQKPKKSSEAFALMDDFRPFFSSLSGVESSFRKSYPDPLTLMQLDRIIEADKSESQKMLVDVIVKLKQKSID